ncbi:MAG: hypothetical protein KIT80_21425 [Chitinophagaceae bacterium]|nr:hypothetical protein [Chitinophagaceae bacterium]MCW5929496.1 hypothetical protein [Chitinophagaceae bacterium]
MTDTPQNIKELQLKVWLSRPPGERLRQFMEDNASLFQFWSMARKQDHRTPDPSPEANGADPVVDFPGGENRQGN